MGAWEVLLVSKMTGHHLEGLCDIKAIFRTGFHESDGKFLKRKIIHQAELKKNQKRKDTSASRSPSSRRTTRESVMSALFPMRTITALSEACSWISANHACVIKKHIQ
jgi:hypothetical protein